jgi:hypothetical protein
MFLERMSTKDFVNEIVKLIGRKRIATILLIAVSTEYILHYRKNHKQKECNKP